MKLWQKERYDDANNNSAKRYFIWNDEMFEINERGHNQPGNENGKHQGEWNRGQGMRMISEFEPASQKRDARQKFHQK